MDTASQIRRVSVVCSVLFCILSAVFAGEARGYWNSQSYTYTQTVKVPYTEQEVRWISETQYFNYSTQEISYYQQESVSYT